VNARRVHAVLAAGVQDPALIAAWRRDPEQLRALGVDPAEVDLDALWKFAGLTVKVRHNGIREDLPLTFRLLHVTELAIDVFASYAARCADEGRRLGAGAEARARDFVEFLEGWLDLERPAHALLWDLVRHERALARLARAAPVQPPPAAQEPAERPRAGARGRAAGAASRARVTGAAVPRLREGVIVHAMRSDPRVMAALLRERTPQLEQVPLEPCCLCYWRAGAEVMIVRLDDSAQYLLALADGVRTAAEIHRELLGGARPTAGFLRLLGELAELGVIVVAAPGRRP
jgi:hypothetical protein